MSLAHFHQIAIVIGYFHGPNKHPAVLDKLNPLEASCKPGLPAGERTVVHLYSCTCSGSQPCLTCTLSRPPTLYCFSQQQDNSLFYKFFNCAIELKSHSLDTKRTHLMLMTLVKNCISVDLHYLLKLFLLYIRFLRETRFQKYIHHFFQSTFSATILIALV